MRRITSFLMLGLLILVAFSCKKDDKQTKKEMLTGKYWIMTACTINPAVTFGTTQITDWYAQMESCTTDDLQKFETNGVYTYDEGASKCDVNDPQTSTGTWSFNADETVVSVTDATGTYSYTVVELSSSKMICKYTENIDLGAGPINYTLTMTFGVK